MNIDAIFVISVREATQRREKMLRWWNHPHIKLNFHIVERNKDPTKGCFQSQVETLQQAKKAGFKRVLILEDDSLPVTDLENLIKRTNDSIECVNTNESQWTYLMLGYFPIRSKKTSNGGVLNIKCAYLANAYIANLANIVIPTWDNEDLDHVLFCKNSDDIITTNVYGIFPMLVRQEAVDSYIAKANIDYQTLFLHTLGQDNIAKMSCYANVIYLLVMFPIFLILTLALIPIVINRKQIPIGSTLYFIFFVLFVILLIVLWKLSELNKTNEYFNYLVRLHRKQL
jgi:hypothetical protein